MYIHLNCCELKKQYGGELLALNFNYKIDNALEVLTMQTNIEFV